MQPEPRDKELHSGKRFIITGGPGFGKSAVVAELARRGWDTRPEVARTMIQKAMESGSELLPWIDRFRFDELQKMKMLADYVNVTGILPTFFDRGLPDLIGWRRFAGLGYDDIVEFVQNYPYEREVFVTPPWRDIYQTNAERPFRFEEAELIHDQLVLAYQQFGYTTVMLERSTVGVRADAIERILNIRDVAS